MPESLYQVLGVEPAADRRQLDAAYKRVAIHFYQCELVQQSGRATVQRVKEAYPVLLEPQSASGYDDWLRKHR
jgi:DnaJ-class molecular chaperone